MSMWREANLLAGCSAMVIAPLLSQKSMVGRNCPKPRLPRRPSEAQVEYFLGALRQNLVLSLLSAEAESGAKLDFPTAGGSVQKEQIRSGCQ
jgi:hypothetical protein